MGGYLVERLSGKHNDPFAKVFRVFYMALGAIIEGR